MSTISYYVKVYTVFKGKKDIQTKNRIFLENYNLTDTPRYVHWTLPNLLHQISRQNPFVYKGLRSSHKEGIHSYSVTGL